VRKRGIAWVKTRQVSVRDRLLPVFGLMIGAAGLIVPSALVSYCGCGLRTPSEGMAHPLSGGIGPPSSTTTVRPVALKRVKSTSVISHLKNGKTSAISNPPESSVTVPM